MDNILKLIILVSNLKLDYTKVSDIINGNERLQELLDSIISEIDILTTDNIRHIIKNDRASLFVIEYVKENDLLIDLEDDNVSRSVTSAYLSELNNIPEDALGRTGSII